MLTNTSRLAKLNSGVRRICPSRRPLLAPLAAMQQPHRTATVTRKTKETEVQVTIDLDGTGVCVAETPVGFLNHMLDQISSHGMFDLKVIAKVRGAKGMQLRGGRNSQARALQPKCPKRQGGELKCIHLVFLHFHVH